MTDGNFCAQGQEGISAIMASAALMDVGADPEALRSSVATLPLDPVDLDRRPSGTKGTVWRYTAIDVGSAHCWAELHVTPRNPSPGGPRTWPGPWPGTWPAGDGGSRR